MRSRFLTRLTTFYPKQNNSSYLLLYQYRNILNFASNPIDPTNDSNNNNDPINISVQYPPPPVQERAESKPSGKKIEPYKDLQFRPKKESKTGGVIPKDTDNDTTDTQSTLPTTPGLNFIEFSCFISTQMYILTDTKRRNYH